MLLPWYFHDESNNEQLRKKKDLLLSNSFNEKMLIADIFEVKKASNKIVKLWQEAKDIEITLDFLQPDGIFGKLLKK